LTQDKSSKKFYQKIFDKQEKKKFFQEKDLAVEVSDGTRKNFSGIKNLTSRKKEKDFFRMEKIFRKKKI